MLAFNGGVREGEVVGKLWAILGHGPLMYLEPNEEHSKGEKMDREQKTFKFMCSPSTQRQPRPDGRNVKAIRTNEESEKD